jgi:hypothetical protein
VGTGYPAVGLRLPRELAAPRPPPPLPAPLAALLSAAPPPRRSWVGPTSEQVEPLAMVACMLRMGSGLIAPWAIVYNEPNMLYL